MRTKFLRTKYITGSRIQMRYLAFLVSSMLIPVIFAVGCLYYLIFTIMAEQIGIPEYIASTLFPVIKKLNFILLIGMPLLFLALMAWGIVLSHSFAGPMERLESEINRLVEEGIATRRLRLRRGDDMKSVADAINRLLDKIEGAGKDERK